MSEQVTNYQCPACTGPLHYDGTLGKLKCDYCESAFTVEEIEALYAEAEEKAAEASAKAEEKEVDPALADWQFEHSGEEWDAEGEHIKAYNCPSCGADLICEETTAASSCPYCGNPSIVPGQLRGVWKPDYVIPFHLDKKAAVAALKKFYRGKIFLPRAFGAENHLEEVKGVYVPFWLFDGEVDADIRFAATNSSSYISGNERVTVTKHYLVRRKGKMSFRQIPVDASSKMPDNHMDSIEPFDYSDLKPFSTAYLPGYLADKYDVLVDECILRAKYRAKNSVSEYLRKDAASDYQTCELTHEDIRLQRGEVSYALFPVWLLYTKWKGEDFLFAMNGQTGKLIGDLPVSRAKFWGLFAGIALPLMIVAMLLLL